MWQEKKHFLLKNKFSNPWQHMGIKLVVSQSSHDHITVTGNHNARATPPSYDVRKRARIKKKKDARASAARSTNLSAQRIPLPTSPSQSNERTTLSRRNSSFLHPVSSQIDRGSIARGGKHSSMARTLDGCYSAKDVSYRLALEPPSVLQLTLPAA
jgi:hypothetical protein